jgi:hypothetical protein
LVVAPDGGVFRKCGRQEYCIVSVRYLFPGLIERGLDLGERNHFQLVEEFFDEPVYFVGCQPGFVLDESAVFVDFLVESFGSE